jgi:hypothetical protein
MFLCSVQLRGASARHGGGLSGFRRRDVCVRRHRQGQIDAPLPIHYFGIHQLVEKLPDLVHVRRIVVVCRELGMDALGSRAGIAGQINLGFDVIELIVGFFEARRRSFTTRKPGPRR